MKTNINSAISNDKHLLSEQARVFKALAHPVRLAILQILREGEHCVCHLEAFLGYRQAYISQQLIVLKQAGIISDKRIGWNVYYSVIDSKIFNLLDVAQQMKGHEVKLNFSGVVCSCPACATQ